MKQKALCIDANLLVLWAVGSVSPKLVIEHKRLQRYGPDDFSLLMSFASRFQTIVMTPNVLTEAANLAAQIREPDRTKVRAALAAYADCHQEHYVRSSVAVKSQAYFQLGLTDAALLELSNSHLLTDDLDLYVAAVSSGKESTNFTHLREAAGITS